MRMCRSSSRRVIRDPVAEEEARRCGAAFVASPLENPGFLRAVRDALASPRHVQRPVRRWLRRPASAVVALGGSNTRATILDLSYGGLRLAFREAGPIPSTFDITLPIDNVMVTAHLVWTASSVGDDQVHCGVELSEADAERWRGFVDSLQDPVYKSLSTVVASGDRFTCRLRVTVAVSPLISIIVPKGFDASARRWRM